MVNDQTGQRSERVSGLYRRSSGTRPNVGRIVQKAERFSTRAVPPRKQPIDRSFASANQQDDARAFRPPGLIRNFASATGERSGAVTSTGKQSEIRRCPQ